MHNQFSQILATLGKSHTPTLEPNAPTLAITTRSGITTHDPAYPNQPSSAHAVTNETAAEEEVPTKKANPITLNPETPLSSTLHHPSKSSNVPFPSRLRKQKKDDEREKFLSIFKHININLPFMEALNQMPKGDKVLKDLLSNKAKIENASSSVTFSEECSADIHKNLPQKKGVPKLHITMSYWNYSKLKLTKMSIQLADRPIKYPMATARAVIDVHDGKLSLRVGEEIVTFNIGKSIKFASSQDDCLYFADHTYKLVQEQWDDTLDHDCNWIDNKEKDDAEEVLKSHKKAIAWGIYDIKGIDLSFCTHKILIKEVYKPCVQPQRRLNPNMNEVVKKEVIKLLDAGIIYPISDSPWVSPVQVVPKKGDMIVVRNEKNELIPQRTITGWRVCIDYMKLHDATRKDYFPFPFIDQMLERLEKTTFTCRYATFAYRRMSFGLCNAPTTFQRCMMAIFHALIKDHVEVFMDDFSIFRSSFDHCIVLGHKISRTGIEVDRVKIKAISKLSHPTNVKSIRSFLGHAGFYRRFRKDFSKITRPMTQLLMKDVKFEFSVECVEAFETLKKELTKAPIMVKPNWSLPFELMYDASDYVVGAVLGQRSGK
ncbi:reverse transcriptase domain-containing protein [Tanacetum coccineum]|uniref:Reverse transcriptase domain-containing protein n=1 Tax=Tanacetum coccineum TaxID=301880 RepID=A0ABQ5D865_9ASTR